MDNPDIQTNTQPSLDTLVVNALSESDPGTLRHKALLSFRASVRRHALPSPSPDAIRLWIADMMLAGLKQSTMRLYFNSIHVLCRSACALPHEDPFEAVRSDLSRDFDFPRQEIADNLSLVRRIIAKASDPATDAQSAEYCDIFLCLLYDVNATIGDVINLRFSDASRGLPQTEDIADRYRTTARTKYVFGLQQRQVRDTQIARTVIAGLSRLLRDEGMRFSASFSRDSIKELWIAAALRCGVTAPEIRGVVKALPAAFSFLEMVTPLPLSEERKGEILRKVADHINDNKKYWYAMQLRPGRTPDDVKETLKEKKYPRREEIGFYYPTRTVYKPGRGKKMKKEEVPYLPGVLFFYVRRDDVAPLFGRYIGEEAWCYRYANDPGSPYSAISRGEMVRFQRAVGEFTDDIRLEMVVRDAPLTVDQLVKVYGGVMAGRVCRITEVVSKKGHREYTLALAENIAVRWTVTNVEDVRLEPLSSSGAHFP